MFFNLILLTSMATGDIKPKTSAKPVHVNSFGNALIISVKLDVRIIVVNY